MERTLKKLRLLAVVTVWGKKEGPAEIMHGLRCEVCLSVHADVWVKAHKRICSGCASLAITEAADAGNDNAIRPLHVLLDNERFVFGRRAS